MTESPEELVDFAVQIARRAGRYLMTQLPLGKWARGEIEHKAGRELVTEVDRNSERMLVAAVRSRFPDHAIVSEEGGAALGANGEAELRWIIDPLDGTTNFLHGHPLFSISLAVQQVPRAEPSDLSAGPEIVAGVIFLPYLDETFLALRGGGAFLNSRSIRLAVSSTAELSDALVATGFAYDRDLYPNYDNFIRIAQDGLGIRRCGSAAIDMAYVAAGRYDVYWELGVKAHDIAAGALLVQEAGGRVTDFAGGAQWLDGANIIASNGQVHEAVQERLDPLVPAD